MSLLVGGGEWLLLHSFFSSPAPPFFFLIFPSLIKLSLSQPTSFSHFHSYFFLHPVGRQGAEGSEQVAVWASGCWPSPTHSRPILRRSVDSYSNRNQNTMKFPTAMGWCEDIASYWETWKQTGSCEQCETIGQPCMTSFNNSLSPWRCLLRLCLYDSSPKRIKVSGKLLVTILMSYTNTLLLSQRQEVLK